MSDLSRCPIDPKTGQPLPPRAQPGYYPGFSTMSQSNFWDEATRVVVVKRVEDPSPLRFFTPDEATLLRAVCDRILPQDDRDEAHRIPIINGIDQRLYVNRGDGYRYESMPPDRDAHRLGLQAIDAIAQHLHGKSFTECGPREQDQALKTIHDGEPPAGQDIWARMPVHRYWMLLVQDVAEQYYAHPWAWDEIGFGGPAYPRAYTRLENGEPEPWEVKEKRYAWDAPPNSLSGTNEPMGDGREHGSAPGQGGTH
ncbi:MAG: gluconate 2-dehydrogenase subunit 3 family protein [Armatimonadota bacterium]|nr:gluconate 2-dehydrogenase subunit 3 family protein [Armatimonadota bacterium]